MISQYITPLHQITRRIRRTLHKSIIEHAVAERQKWSKFGAEKGNKPGPYRVTTIVGENVAPKLSEGNKMRIAWSVYPISSSPLFSFLFPVSRTGAYSRRERQTIVRAGKSQPPSLQRRSLHRKVSLQRHARRVGECRYTRILPLF